MAVGRNRHDRIAEINGRHFLQTGKEAGLPKALVRATIEGNRDASGEALRKLESELPPGFPEEIHASVKDAVLARLGALSMTEAA